MESNRVDIGLFALAGEQVSAPAFFCVTTLDNEDRKYDDNGRLLSITYTGADEAWQLCRSRLRPAQILAR
jgi:hypothetical protein